MIDKIIILAVIVITVFFDALRDGWYGRIGWWKWHIVKWIAFYTPIIYILWVNFAWYWILAMAIPAWLLWRLGLRLTGQKWDTWLTKRFYIQWIKTSKEYFSIGVSLAAYNKDFWYLKIYIIFGYLELGVGEL